MGTISIKGIGKAKRDPDLVIFKISTSTTEKEYDDSLDKSARMVDELKDAFESIGFKREDLKTSYYEIRQVFDYVEVGLVNKKRERQFIGFKVFHDLKIEFDLDNHKINEVLKCLKEFKDDSEFEIKFSVKNKDQMKREVITDATRNARFNAEILAEASSVELGDLIKIDYGLNDYGFMSDSGYDFDMISNDYNSYIDFTPDSIKISDVILFVWETR